MVTASSFWPAAARYWAAKKLKGEDFGVAFGELANLGGDLVGRLGLGLGGGSELDGFQDDGDIVWILQQWRKKSSWPAGSVAS